MERSYALGMVPLAECRFKNIRQDFGSEEEQRRLGESLRKRQHAPLFRTADGLVYDGERRVRAGRLVGLTELLAITTAEPLTPEQMTEIQFESAHFRADLTGYEKWQAVAAILAAHPAWTNKQLADHLTLDPKMVKILLSPGQCLAEVQEALRNGSIGISVCHEISLLPPEQQLSLLNLKLAGASRDEIARRGRKERNGATPADRLQRGKFVRPSGTTISLAGQALSLEEAASELAELATAMRKADRDGISFKTFMKACRDRAESVA